MGVSQPGKKELLSFGADWLVSTTFGLYFVYNCKRWSGLAKLITYLKKRIAAFGYSFKGLADLVTNHPHAHIHAAATVMVIVLGLYFQINREEWMFLTICIGIVWTAEAFNTSIEYLTDLVSPDYHPLAGKVKDVAAAAVLLSCIAAAIVGVFVFWPYLKAI